MRADDDDSIALQQSLRITSDELEADLKALLSDIKNLSSMGSPYYLRLDAVFGITARRVTGVEIARLSEGAFTLIAGKLTINKNAIAPLFDAVDSDVIKKGVIVDPFTPDLVKALKLKVFRQFVLHELRHIPQGLAEFKNVGALKKLAGERYMAELDLIADHHAAIGYAAIECWKINGDQETFNRLYQEALYFIAKYCFRAFDFNSSRPHKMARAVSLILMQAHVTNRLGDTDASKSGSWPLDCCISVQLSHDYSSYAIIVLSPEVVVVGFSKDDDISLIGVVDAIESNDIVSAVAFAITMLHDIEF